MNTDQAKALSDNAVTKLMEALEGGQSETLKAYLAVMSRFHRYSWNNALLIYMQCPNATHVAGFHAWLHMRRYVRKGEKGIAILAPIVGHKKSIDGELLEDEQTKVFGFRAAHVFDISQTDGEDLAEFATVKGDPREYLQALKVLVASHAIALDYDAAIAPAKGVSRGGRITLLPGQPAAEEFSTLVHELAHEKLHRAERRTETTKTIRETEAEAVAFVVCQAIRLDTNTAAADYIKLYNGDRATLSASLHFIQSTAAEILTALNASAEPLQKAAAHQLTNYKPKGRKHMHTEEMQTLEIPLNKLLAWNDNVRVTGVEDGIGELADSIAAVGLLQGLVVKKEPRGKYAVIAGRRRLLALSQLAENGKIKTTMPVPCRIAPKDADLPEISLTENVVRVPMHPADEFEAFQRLIHAGKSIADVAARFGVTEAVVLRRIALGRVHANKTE